jgi:DNA-binding transcriptional LysR family regulator
VDLRRLRYFVAVAESLHFGQAAIRLGITQPALSQQVQRLEQELGVTLLARTSRRITLTEAGLTVLDPLRRCLAAYEEAIHNASMASRESRQEQLRIGIPCLEAGVILEPMLRNVVHRFPDTRVALTELTCEHEATAVQDRQIDVGFVHLPVDGPDLTSMVVHRDELMVLLPHNHPCAKDERVDLRELEDEPFIEFQAHCPAYQHELKQVFRRSGFTPHIEYSSTGLTGIVQMVGLRLGVAVVPGSSFTRDSGKTVARRLNPGTKKLDLALVWRRDTTSSAVARMQQMVTEMARVSDSPPLPPTTPINGVRRAAA